MRRDENVHQHLLRALRRDVAATFGMNPADDHEPTNAEIMHAAILTAVLDLAAFGELLDRKGEDELGYVVEGIRRRLDLAGVLGGGCLNPDHPYETASAMEYHPRGIEGCAAEIRARNGEAS
jgi:hypothetical protein